MISRDPRCVFVADSLGLAEVVALFLSDQGLAAEVMSPATLGGLDGLTVWSSHAVAARGIEVWVLDPSTAPRARELLERQAAQLAARTAERGAAGDITAVCEDCGQDTVFPGTEAGKVLNCRWCGAYLDVPDGSEFFGLGDADDEESEEN